MPFLLSHLLPSFKKKATFSFFLAGHGRSFLGRMATISGGKNDDDDVIDNR